MAAATTDTYPDAAAWAALEARVRALEDREALLQLKARYAQLCDQKYAQGALRGQPELDRTAREIADLFTDDAVWDGGERFGVSRGPEEIYQRFRRGTFSYAIHFFVQPDISIEGDTARARWYLLEAATQTDGTAVWIAGHEDDDYVRTDAGWRVRRMVVELAFVTPFDQGWAKRNLVG